MELFSDPLALQATLCVLMFVAAVFLLLAGYPVAFTLAGTAFIFAGLADVLGVFDFNLLRALPQRILAIMQNEVLVAVPLFVFMGVMLERSKVAEDLLTNMGRAFGAMRGGLGISVIVVGALLAASTGIVGATVVTMGLIALPTMLRFGYNKSLATGIISSSGTLGQIIPPSIVLVLLADQLQTSYSQAQRKLGIFSPEAVSVGDLFAGAMLPGLVLVGLYICYQIFMAAWKPGSSPAIPEDKREAVSTRALMNALVAPIVLIIAVLGSIFTGIATPTEAASVGAVGAILLAGLRVDDKHGLPMYTAALGIIGLLILKQIRGDEQPDVIIITLGIVFSAGVLWGLVISLVRTFRTKVLKPVMRGTMEISAMVFVILIGAAAFSLAFRGLNGDQFTEEILLSMPGGTVGAVLVVMAVMFFLGFFLDFLEIIFIVVPIVAPILLTLEMPGGETMSPVWLGIMMAINLQTSFLTPPFGFSLFYLRGVAPPSVKTTQIYRGVIPFVIIQITMLIILFSWPEVATWLPTLTQL